MRAKLKVGKSAGEAHSISHSVHSYSQTSTSYIIVTCMEKICVQKANGKV